MAISSDIKISPKQLLKVLRQQNLLVPSDATFGAWEEDDAAVPLVTNSNEISSGCIFLAYQGVTFDAHTLIGDALSQGVKLAIGDSESLSQKGYIQTKNSRASWSHLCAFATGNPQNSLTCCGVTGTNGKTSVVWMLRQMLCKSGFKVMSIGTLGAWINDHKVYETKHTTPDPPVLFHLLKLAKEESCDYVVMEAASHSLWQQKLVPIKFDAVAFTSFSRDHLDLHGSMEAYFSTKKSLFENYCKPDAFQLIHDSIDFSPKGAQKYGKRNVIEYQAEVGRTSVEVLGRRFSVALVGSFAVENFVCAALLYSHLTKGELIESLGNEITAPPGRLEKVGIKSSHDPLVCVDYAHTPEAIAITLKALRPITSGRLWIVFGCGGERDPGKRPLMGARAEEFADEIVITTDNPRGEDRDVIIQQILAGLDASSPRCHVIVERREAIQYAITAARPQDCILIAGKGHEDYMEIKGERISFDDRIVALEGLKSRA